jgi:hypothetical protein
MVSDEVATEMHRITTEYYGIKNFPATTSRLIWKQFHDLVSDEDYKEAFSRHMRGCKFAPRISEIEEQLQNIYMDRLRAKNQAHFEKYGSESDRTAAHIMAGRDKDGKKTPWGDLIREQIAISHDYRTALQDELGLDYTDPACVRILMETLRTSVDSNGMLRPIKINRHKTQETGTV